MMLGKSLITCSTIHVKSDHVELAIIYIRTVLHVGNQLHAL